MGMGKSMGDFLDLTSALVTAKVDRGPDGNRSDIPRLFDLAEHDLVEEVLRLVLASNQLDYRILNETTALVFPNTPQKQRDYQEMVVKAFYLANADVKQAYQAALEATR